MKYLIRKETEALWNFLRVMGRFQSSDAVISLPFLPCPHFHSHAQRKRIRGRRWEGLQPPPSRVSDNIYLQGFRHLLHLSLIPCPTWLVLQFLFSLVPHIWWSSYNLSYSPVSCLIGRGTEFECKGKLSNCASGFQGIVGSCIQVSGPGKGRFLFILVTMTSASL